MFSACIAPDKDKTKVEVRESMKRIDTFPNGSISYNQLDWEQVLVDTSGKHAYLGLNAKGQGQWMTKDSTWKKAAVIPRNVYWLTMSKKMVKHFMKVSDYFTESFLWALLLSIIVAGGLYVFLKKDLIRLAGKGAVGIYVVVALAVPFRMFQKRPSELAMNNVMQLSKAEYEAELKRDPTFETFWKEKWANNGLTGLSND
jgi:hypothetical protein